VRRRLRGPPGVQNRRDGDVGAEVLGIGGNGEHRPDAASGPGAPLRRTICLSTACDEHSELVSCLRRSFGRELAPQSGCRFGLSLTGAASKVQTVVREII
jgi:hypothetical protein